MVALHYEVMEPTNFDVTIANQSDQVLRTFKKSYAAAAVEDLVWDGRDGSGRVVPDGNYKIKLLKYVFSVTVDNTPPWLAYRSSR